MAKKFMEAETLEEFKEYYIRFHKQELALDDGFSYFDVTTSNADGTFVGEAFDNQIRLKALKDNNKEFLAQVNEDELMEIVKKEFEQDKINYINSEH